MTGMTLFSGFERSDASAKRWGESRFEFLDRSARDDVATIRAELEQWAAAYPLDELSDLVGRFRSTDDAQHEGALFELLLHELLRRLDCSIELHPDVEGSDATPDFLVADPAGRSFYLEATICMDRTAEEVAAENRLADLRDSLDRISDNRFIFDLRWQGVPQAPISGRRIRDQVERDLRNLSHEEIRARLEDAGWDSLPRWTYQFEGFHIRLKAIPRRANRVGEELGRAIGMSSGGVRRLSTDQSIRDAVQRKAGKYGELSLPFVVAVNVIAEFPPQMIDVWNALLGREALEVTLYEDGTTRREETRLPDGVWLGPEGPTYTRLSAVLIGRPIRPWNLHSAPVHLIKNPWAADEHESVLNRLPRWIPSDDRLEEVAGESMGSLLRLPEGWPNPG